MLPHKRFTGLPSYRGPLTGRERDTAAVCALLLQDNVPLVTLTGPGGVGKTRLALHIAAEVTDAFSDGVVFASIAPTLNPALVCSSLARILGIRNSVDEDATSRLCAHLRDQSMLLLIDNFEQVVEAAPEIAELLTTCPNLKMLITSRVRLRISEEHEYPVAPLGLAQQETFTVVDASVKADADRLFIERARQADPNFVVTESNGRAISAICRRLDGLPLAIELAAARAKVLPPSAMLTRLDRSLLLLTMGRRDAPDRHQNMRDAIAWSYDLLTPEEQALFRCLGAFVGGCSMEAAESVARQMGLEGNVLDDMTSLIDSSLLQDDEGPVGERRFVMLETVRDYALEQLEICREDQLVKRAHADYFLSFAETDGNGSSTHVMMPTAAHDSDA